MVEAEAEARLVELERENSRLRRLLAELPAELPNGPFPALAFRRKAQQFALAASVIREVVSAVWPEPVADAPRGVLGRFVYEGNLISLVDLMLAEAEPLARILSPSMLVVVVNTGTGMLGVLADEVSSVRVLDPRAAVGLAAAPSTRQLASFLDASGEPVHLLSPRQIAAEFCR